MADHLDRRNIVAYRMARHFLTKPLPAGQWRRAAAIGLQNTPPGTAALSLALRVPDLPSGFVEQALAVDKTLPQAWCMRSSPYVFPTEDLPVFTGALAPHTEEEMRESLGGVARLAADAGRTALDVVAEATEALRDALDGTVLTKRQMGVALGQRMPRHADWFDPDTFSSFTAMLVRPISLAGLFCFAPRSGNEASVGRQAEFNSLRQRYGQPQPFLDRAWHEQRCAALADMLADAQVKAPAGLDDDLSEVLTVADAGRYPVFSPGDICPDNNLLTGRGLQVFDFEGASYHSVFLDAAYTVMPFATCWCVFRLPPQIRDEIESAFRGEVIAPYPALCDDEVWRPGLRRAAALWTIDMTTLVLPTLGSADRAMHPVRRPVPTMRQLLRYRWQWLVEQLESADDLPALAQAMRGLLEATGHWNVESMPAYPPWR